MTATVVGSKALQRLGYLLLKFATVEKSEIVKLFQMTKCIKKIKLNSLGNV
jgi:hypothetical protein